MEPNVYNLCLFNVKVTLKVNMMTSSTIFIISVKYLKTLNKSKIDAQISIMINLNNRVMTIMLLCVFYLKCLLRYLLILQIFIYSVTSFCFHHFFLDISITKIPLSLNYIHPLKWRKKPRLSVLHAKSTIYTASGFSSQKVRNQN